MKKFLLTLVVLAIAAASFAQEQTYRPVPFQMDNSVWYEFYVDGDAYEVKHSKGDWYHYGSYTLDTRDTIINNSKYRHVIAELNGVLYDSSDIFIREDTTSRKVYVKTGVAELILFDFSLEVGDTAPIHSATQQYPVVQSIDTINIGGVLRKKINFMHNNAMDVWFGNGTYYTQELSWIEGIGSTQGLLFPFFGDVNTFTNALVCFSQNDTVIYHEPHFTDCMPTASLITPEAAPRITAYPNPAKERVTLDFGDSRFDRLKVINTAGVVVREADTHGQTQYTLPLKGLPKGIYSCILSGKDGTATEKIIVE